jgi:hypothetical protein
MASYSFEGPVHLLSSLWRDPATPRGTGESHLCLWKRGLTCPGAYRSG